MSGPGRRAGEGRVPRLIRRPLGHPASVSARRAPFALLIVVLLGTGLITLLLLNSSLNQGSFELSRLERQTNDLTDEQQALQQEVDELARPDALQRRARELGLVPGGGPAFLNPDGTVRGVPAPVTGAPTTRSAPTAALPPALRPSTPAAPAPSAGPAVPTVGTEVAPTPQPSGAAPRPPGPAPSATAPGLGHAPGAAPPTGRAEPRTAPAAQPLAPGAETPAHPIPTSGR